MIWACVSGSIITAATLLLSPKWSILKMAPLVKEPPKHAMAAMPMGSPVSPSMAVRAMELRGDVQIILMTPPSRSPIRIGDCSVAAVIMPPMCARAAFTAGSTRNAMNLAIGAIRREMNNSKWTLFAIAYQCGFAYLISLIVFQFGCLFAGDVNVIGLIAAVIALAGIIYMLVRKNKYDENKLTVSAKKKDKVKK